DQRDNALKIPNAALRYTPPGTQREQLRGRGTAVPEPVETEPRQAAALPEGRENAAPRLAPGQKWDPGSKLKMLPPKRAVQRPGVVYVLDAQQKPEPRRVMLGITDGSTTEVVSGEVKSGDLLIIGDSSQTA